MLGAMETSTLTHDRSIEIRAAVPSDRTAVLELLATSLGWSSDDYFAAFFSWKQEQNPFGPSPAWVAVADGWVVGFRTFLRWEHRVAPGGAGGDVLRTVRAVDTATHPSHQGRGSFRRMTLEALEELRAGGADFVFNTPNDQSRPGYLKMGWVSVGRLSTSVRVVSPGSLARLVGARVHADLRSAPANGGRPAADVLADPGLADLLGSLPASPRLATHRTPAYMRWRYGFGPLDYRAVTLDGNVRAGLAVFRLRRRGPALECALCEVLTPGDDPGVRQALVRSVARECRADYLVRLGGRLVDRSAFVRLPRQGPVLTWYPLADRPPGRHLHEWSTTLGDVELF
jgi:GNAT superfamily N-acetyltransferase